MVERSLKLDALSLDWSRYVDNLENNTFSFVLLQEKNCETKGCVLSLLNLVNLLSVEKELGWGERLVQHTDYYSKCAIS